jgi:hypothetical protein
MLLDFAICYIIDRATHKEELARSNCVLERLCYANLVVFPLEMIHHNTAYYLSY